MCQKTVTAKWLAAAGCAGWLAVASWALVPCRAQAFPAESLESVEMLPAVDELLGKLGYEQDQCLLQRFVATGSGRLLSGSRFKVECPDRVLFIKALFPSRPEALSAAFELMERNMPQELAASVLQPLAEFSFLKEQPDGTVLRIYLGVYPWIKGVTIGDLIEIMSRTGFDSERLKALYSRIGTLMGSLHKAGLVEPDEPLDTLGSHLVHGDLHDHNIMVTPQWQIVFLDLDHFSDPRRESPCAVHGDITRFASLVLIPGTVAHNASWAPAWRVIEPLLEDSFQKAYCRSLAGEQKQPACMAQMTALLAANTAFQNRLKDALGPTG